MGIDLSIIWFVIIVFSTLMYILMDGFDLGIGILFPFNTDEVHRDMMVNSVAPVWDGNETWLVLGGAALYGAFPLAYAVILDALFLPLIIMLIGLIFRGVAFEFRFKAVPQHRKFWDKAFIIGSVVATFSQGVVLGSVINGLEVTGRSYSGEDLVWLSPFPLFCGFGLLIAYALLGSTWLILKSEGKLYDRMCNLALPLTGIMFWTIVIISIWTPITHPEIASRWFNWPNIVWFSPVPFLVILFTLLLYRSISNKSHYQPFMLTLGLMFLGFTGLGISLWPNIIPPSVDIWQAASPSQSQGFMLVGGLLIIPIILVYTSWTYYVFRGKVKPGESYH